jgi:hypothetical protein
MTDDRLNAFLGAPHDVGSTGVFEYFGQESIDILGEHAHGCEM